MNKQPNKQPKKHPRIDENPEDVVGTIYCNAKNLDSFYPEFPQVKFRPNPEPPII